MDIVIGPMDVIQLTAGICPRCGSAVHLPITIPEPDEDEDEPDTPLEP